MPQFDTWEPWMQKIVREVIGWLHAWDPDISSTPRESRRDNAIGLIWNGNEKYFNVVYFRRLSKEFHIAFKIELDVYSHEIGLAGLWNRYSGWNKRRVILLDQGNFRRNKKLLRQLTRAAYDRAIMSQTGH